MLLYQYYLKIIIINKMVLFSDSIIWNAKNLPIVFLPVA